MNKWEMLDEVCHLERKLESVKRRLHLLSMAGKTEMAELELQNLAREKGWIEGDIHKLMRDVTHSTVEL